MFCKSRGAFGTSQSKSDKSDTAGEIQEHLAGVEDYELAEATWQAAIARWPKAVIILRQGARVVRDSRRPRIVK
jgi:hypothetical protein